MTQPDLSVLVRFQLDGHWYSVFRIERGSFSMHACIVVVVLFAVAIISAFFLIAWVGR